ncbi:hypothetical protein Kpol_2001p54 [Vanderwaltozyma polyspora DSM 70294]|uniref:ubiquitinyl hydrolase 1 n=1 Tax=Vanderwaltozyma polyspora (strain ATCC 22028 / DSM 70294 / BCRC 21397 / CBS 2163 / NBRC 10782 / NRRL Y-8283 / UCD 57-17) TaxID=436907 RepID=A7TGT6_VANPO|nr:uncharacterized protein Kpol_2001p54 [Vanderwaltozyma polyspora DSM 70294]EDO18549.1 hypothetical protein Kpol_2001p54 [Vanderwaltozyma polyspora DSM 70294]
MSIEMDNDSTSDHSLSSISRRSSYLNVSDGDDVTGDVVPVESMASTAECLMNSKLDENIEVKPGLPEYPEITDEVIPSLPEQRHLVLQLAKEADVNAKEGDKVYIIPQRWYDNFMDPDIQDFNQIGSIDTNIICKDYDNFILNDYDVTPYLSIQESVFEKISSWYGLAPNSKPIVTCLIYDDQSGSLVTEYNRCIFRLHYLTEDSKTNQYRHHLSQANSIPFFTLSMLATVKELMSKILNVFYEKESHLDIEKTKFKVWFAKDSELNQNNSILNMSYKLDPYQFMSLPFLTRITEQNFGNTLKNLKIETGDFVIEIKQEGKNYHWLSNYFHYNALTPSRGNIGLNNLGNTCYMNSALQCLVHIPQLRDYFLYKVFEKEINLDNPLGYQGHVARSFAILIQNLFKDELLPSLSYSPTTFKSTVGHFNSMFSGYLQQDSQEFIAFLLDGLHEDLNRITNKPVVEKPSLKPEDDVSNQEVIKKLADDTWNSHLLRNDSIITDIFVGLYKSTLHCPECDNLSVTFDPYNDLTLPLPVDTKWNTKIKLFPQNSPPCIIEIEMEKTSTYQELKEYIANLVKMNPSDLYGFEIFNHQFYNSFDSDKSNSNYLPLKELISDADDIIFYEIKSSSPADMVVPVINTKLEEGFKNPRLFGVPFFVTLKEDELNNPAAIRKVIETSYTRLSGGFVEFPLLELTENSSIEMFPLVKEKYPTINFGKYNPLIELANPDMSVDEYFKLRLMELTPNQQIRSRNATFNSDNGFRNDVWVPLSHININKAIDITGYLDPVSRNIYNYLDLKNKFIEKDQGSDDCVEENDDTKSSTDDNEEESLAKDNDSESRAEFIDQDTDMSNNDLIPQILKPTTFILAEWTDESANRVFTQDKVVDWETPAELKNIALEDERKKRQMDGEKKITLDDCLNLFAKKEVLGMNDSWYCPTCKEHRQATKQLQLWSTPDILLIHLKRFENQSSFSDKIDDTVYFPITDLDLSPYVVNNDESKSTIYDLVSVDNHYGGLGGGHYTAYVKNFVDKKWYYFDDSRVTETVPERSIAGSAYLLFYMRRSDNTVGGEELKNLILKARSEFNLKLQEFSKRQESLFLTNQTDEEDTSGEEDNEDDTDSRLNLNEADKSDFPVEDQSGSSRSTDYSIESMEVGYSKANEVDNTNGDNSGRRKLRMLNKKYNVSTANSPASLSPSEDSDGNSVSIIRSESDSVSTPGSDEVAKSPVKE